MIAYCIFGAVTAFFTLISIVIFFAAVSFQLQFGKEEFQAAPIETLALIIWTLTIQTFSVINFLNFVEYDPCLNYIKQNLLSCEEMPDDYDPDMFLCCNQQCQNWFFSPQNGLFRPCYLICQKCCKGCGTKAKFSVLAIYLLLQSTLISFIRLSHRIHEFESLKEKAYILKDIIAIQMGLNILYYIMLFVVQKFLFWHNLECMDIETDSEGHIEVDLYNF